MNSNDDELNDNKRHGDASKENPRRKKGANDKERPETTPTTKD